MKTLKYFLVALIAGAAVQLSAQVNLNDLSRAIAEDRDNAAALVEEAVAQNPEDVNVVVRRLLAEHPGLAEEIIAGAVVALPFTEAPDLVSDLVAYAIQFRPGLAPEIVRGAIRATDGVGGMEERIIIAARTTLRRIQVGAIGQTSASSEPEIIFNDTLRISPAAQ